MKRDPILLALGLLVSVAALAQPALLPWRPASVSVVDAVAPGAQLDRPTFLTYEREEVERLLRLEGAVARRLSRWGVENADEIGRALVDEALAAGLDPALVVAMVAVESSFRVDARSRVGAVGLLQVMPATGAYVAERTGVEWHGERTLLDPAENLRLGVAYMAELIDDFDGDVDHALVAYNRGPTKVRRSLARGRALPMGYAQKVRHQSREIEAEVALMVAAYQPVSSRHRS